MVDLRPLLFVNALALMLLVTAGFASLKTDQSPASVATPVALPSIESSAPSNATDTTGSPALIALNETSQQPTISLLAQTDFSAEIEQFRGEDEISPTSIDDAILFMDQLTPEQQSRIAFSEPETVSKQETLVLASSDANQVKSLAKQTVDAETKPVTQPKTAVKPKLPTTGTLVVRSNVVGDRVEINGKHHGSTALTKKLPPGDYEVVVSKNGYQNWRSNISLAAGDDRTLVANLKPVTIVQYESGVWRHGIVSGQGTYKGPDGSYYRGDFANKVFHGRGQLIMADKTEYSGEWMEGQKHGLGTLSKANGDSYTGEFRNDAFNGQGTLTLNNGDIYTGYWVDGKLSGQGTYTGKDGTLYVGGFSESQFHGNGSLTFPDGTYYEGGFANNNYQGKGTLVYADGKKYQGQFFEGKFHGQGELLNPNGSKISGTFKFGEPFGLATLTTPEGEVFTARSTEPGVCYRLKSYRATQCPPMEGW